MLTVSVKNTISKLPTLASYLCICSAVMALCVTDSYAVNNFQTTNTTIENTMLRLATEYNDPSAQYLVGRNYLNGNSVKPNVEEAIKWFEMAAKQNHIRALYQLGVIYLYGQGVKQNLSLAYKYLYKAALKNHLESQYELGKYFLMGSHPKYDKAAEWFKRAAERDHIRAMYELGKLTYEGHGIERDPVTGIRLITQASDSGYQAASKYLKTIDGQKEITHQTGQDIVQQFSKSVDGKSTVAFSDANQSTAANENYRLGLAYLTGDGRKKDTRKAAEYMQKAANNDHPYAQYQLAKLYQQGIGVKQNQDLYLMWLHKASDAGVNSARRDLEAFELGKKLDNASNQNSDDPAKEYALAMKYYSGSGVSKDPLKASKLLLKAADQNYSKAQYQLGIMYKDGVGFAKDYQKARQWLQKSADNGNSDAKLAILKIPNNGEDNNNNHNGIPALSKSDNNKSAAPQLLDRKSAPITTFLADAKKGDNNAQYEVGLRYLEGNDGYEHNVSQAIKWLKEAATNNNIDASAKLGMLYYRGKDVDKDYQNAAKWLSKAAESGDAESQYLMGSMYKEGLGVEKNTATAVKWYRKAANQGHKEARKLLGGCRIC